MAVLLKASRVIQGSPELIVEDGQILIGRLPSNHLAIPGGDIEPIHAMVELDDENGQAAVIDMASETGVRVNGKKIDVTQAIKPGDVIEIGAIKIEVIDPAKRVAAISDRATMAMDNIPPVPPKITRGTSVSESSPVISKQRPSSSQQPREEEAKGPEKFGTIFKPGRERPSGSTLEIVAFWDESILDVRHYGGTRRQGEEERPKDVIIGSESDGHLIGVGPKADCRNMRLAHVEGGRTTVYLEKGMSARIRRGGSFEKIEGRNKFNLGSKEIAFITYGPVSYFLNNVSLPNPILRKFEDPDAAGVIAFSASILYGILATGIYVASRVLPPEKQFDDDPWAQVLTVRTPTPEPKKPIPPPKPKVEVPTPKPIAKVEPPKPPKIVTPAPAPKPTEAPKKVVSLEKPKVPTPPSPAQVAKNAPAAENKAKDNALGPKDNAAKAGNSGGPKGGTAGAFAGKRQGAEKSNMMGVEGGKKNVQSGINLDQLGAGLGKVTDVNAVGAIATGLKSSAGGAGGGAGSGARGSHGFGGLGSQNSLNSGGPARALAGLGGGAGGLGAGGLGGAGGDGDRAGKMKAEAVAVPEGDPAVDGGLSKEEIDAVIRANLAQIKACYERNLQRDRDLAGRVKTFFTIGADGRVSAASIDSSTLGSPGTESCITGVVKRWKFPLPRGGSAVQVRYPFVFSSR